MPGTTRLGWSAALALAWSCSASAPPVSAPAVIEASIVTTERGPRGGRLVVVREDGTRLGDLTRIASEAIIDANPAFSPDGQWVVFSSTRERASLEENSLWVVPSRIGETPRRLTRAPTGLNDRGATRRCDADRRKDDRDQTDRCSSGAPSDRDPVFSPDGQSVVFASNRGGSFDLWRLELERGEDGWPVAAGEPVQLTDQPSQELSPAFFPDGRAVVYMSLDAETRTSSLWILPLPLGEPRRLTDGPSDLTPSVSPDGGTVVFAAPVKARDDVDLFAVDADGKRRRPIVDEPYADQTGPTWSADGRYLFATSLYRSAADGKPILSSLVFVDTTAERPVFRALHDPSAVESRIGAAVASRPLDARALAQNRPYLEALRAAIGEHLLRLEQQAEE